MGDGRSTVDPDGAAEGRTLTARARRRAHTSHSTLAAYEQGRKTPNVDTLDRILTACGFHVDVTLEVRPADVAVDPVARGRELVEVLELAEMFPARHSPTLTAPRFGAVV